MDVVTEHAASILLGVGQVGKDVQDLTNLDKLKTPNVIKVPENMYNVKYKK